MERILFIIPPYIAYDSFVNPDFNERTVAKKSGNYGSVVTDMPIGVLSLSAYIKKQAATETKLIDFNVVLNKLERFEYKSFSELFRDFILRKEYLNYSPTIIGISTLFTPAYYNMLDIAKVTREIFPASLIITGGGVPTNMYKDIFRDSTDFDAFCYGEGEKPLLELVQAPDKKELLKTHLSWITKEKIENKQAFHYDFIENLDEIPFYDYDILNPSDYALAPTISSYASFGGERKIFHIATSRGCPHRCSFCASWTVHGRMMRYHSLERVIEDLKRLQEQYGAEKIGIQDDNFIINRERALKIINTIKELKMTVFFQSGLALYALDREMLETLKGAGINQLVLPIESGSSRVLREIMHKPINLSIVNRVIADCRDLKIDTDANVLIGLPGETKQDIEDTRTFLKTLNANWFRIYIATPLVGSEMFDACVKNKYLKCSHIGSDFKDAVIETEDFTAEYIKEKAYSLNLELNFVNNSDFRLGNYNKALEGFENTMKVKDDHAFAHYFAAKCYQELNQKEKYENYKSRYQKIINESEFWKNYANRFRLPVLL